MGVRPRVFEVQPRVGIGPVLLGITPPELRRAAGRCKVTHTMPGPVAVDRRIRPYT
jgi:hypothetical protein